MGMEAVSQKNMSMVDLAYEMLKTEKQPLPLQELIDRIREIKQFSDEDLEDQIARFYTNMNLDGRFMFIGENHWGLKKWYPFDQSKEDIEIPEPKRKRKKKKAKEEDFDDSYEEEEDYEDEEDFEDYDEEDEDYEENSDEDDDDEYKND